MTAPHPIVSHQPPRPSLRVLCAWCEDAPNVPADEARTVSHGICRGCAVRYFGIDPAKTANV